MYQRELWASCWGWFLRSRKGIISIVKFWPGRGDKPTEKGLCIEWICDIIQTDLVNCRFGDVLIVSTCPLKLQETQDQQPNQEWKTTFFPLIVFHCVFLCFFGGFASSSPENLQHKNPQEPCWQTAHLCLRLPFRRDRLCGLSRYGDPIGVMKFGWSRVQSKVWWFFGISHLKKGWLLWMFTNQL